MLSPETIRLMAQTYEEWMQDPATLSRPLETMTWAYQEICAGEDPWTGLGSFSHAWYGYAKGRRAALVTEPLVKPEQGTEYTHRWGAFCAASVEFLCDRYDIPCPDWVHDPSYTLETPWWHTGQADDPSMRERLLHMTPAPFARRNIFCSNRLFQNKYEMYEWTSALFFPSKRGLADNGSLYFCLSGPKTKMLGALDRLKKEKRKVACHQGLSILRYFLSFRKGSATSVPPPARGAGKTDIVCRHFSFQSDPLRFCC